MIFLSVHSEYPKVDEQEFEKISVSINLYLFIFSNFSKKTLSANCPYISFIKSGLSG